MPERTWLEHHDQFGERFNADLDEVSLWIGERLEPDQVFTEEDLDDWAKAHGWRKK